MLSHKTKKSFVYEEEFDQSQGRPGNLTLRSNKECLTDSLDSIRNLRYKFNVGGEEYNIDQDGNAIMWIIPLLNNIKQCLDNKTKTYNLPKFIDKKHFDLFLHFQGSSQAGQIDLSTSKRLIDISMYFKSHDAIKRIISQCISPNIDKSTCIRIINDYINAIYEDEYKSLFIDLIQTCISVASKNIFYIINNMEEELFTLTDEPMEEIIERYFESVMFNSSIDHSLIMRVMMKTRKINDIFDLLENERRRAISSFEKMYEEGLQPTIIWKIKSEDPTSGFYKESEEFNFGNVSIVLINYYDATKDVYNMALKINEVKGNCISDIGSEINCNSNTNTNNILSNQQQFIISILSICEIKELNFKSKINFNCIFSNTKTKILVSKIENFSKCFHKSNLNFENLDYSLVIYFSISYNFSSVLAHICKNFYEYHSLNSLSKISKNVLNIILKNESLNLRTEDEALYAVMNWINSRPTVTEESCIDVCRNLNWNSLSLDGLLDFIISQSKMLINSHELQGLVVNEFFRRFKEEYAGSEPQEGNTSSIKSSKKRNQSCSLGNQSQSKSNSSFTSELIGKLIKIASKYETPYSYKPQSGNYSNNSSINNNHNSKSVSDKILNSSSRNLQPNEDSKSLQANNSIPMTAVIQLDQNTPHVNHPEIEIVTRNLPENLGEAKIHPRTTKKPGISPSHRVFSLTSSHNIGNSSSNEMKKKIFKCNILAQSKEEKISVESKILLRREISENNLFKTRSKTNIFKERNANSVSQDKQKNKRQSPGGNRVHPNVGNVSVNRKYRYHYQYPMNGSKNEQGSISVSVSHLHNNLEQSSLKKKSSPTLKRIPTNSNTIDIVKRVCDQNQVNKNIGMSKILSYAKQVHSIKSENSISKAPSVKFIKKESRAKSATGVRSLSRSSGSTRI